MPSICDDLRSGLLPGQFSNLKLEPNPDISGIGVLIGFVVTAWMSFFSMAFHCLVASRESVNLLDSLLYRGIERILGEITSPHWAQIMETAVLAMSDQQLATGLAILISGYYQMQNELSVYHWQMVTNIAWFSCTTHLSSLVCLEQYFKRHRLIWYARLLLMTGLVVMLVTATISFKAYKGSSKVLLSATAPAKCFFWTKSLYPTPPSIIGAIMLLVGFVVRIVQMFPVTRTFLSTFFKMVEKQWRRGLAWSCGKLQVSSCWTQALFLPMVLINLAFLVSIQCFLDFSRSRTFGILWLLVSLTWGTMRLEYIRNSVYLGHPESPYVYNTEDMKEENTWSFGQLVPILLLLVPFLLVSEGISEMVHKSHIFSEEDSSHSSISSPIETQIHLQNTLHGIDESSHNTQNQPDQMLDNLPQFMKTNNGSLEANNGATECAIRISRLCKEEFRHQPWYQHNILSIVAVMAEIAVLTLPLAQISDDLFAVKVSGLSYLIEASIPFFIATPVIIPLYGIQSMIDSTELTQRCSISPVRLAVDPGKRYFASRCVFFLSYFGFSLIFSVYYFYGNKYEVSNVLLYRSPIMAPPVFACLLAFCAAVFMNTASIYRQLFPQRTAMEV